MAETFPLQFRRLSHLPSLFQQAMINLYFKKKKNSGVPAFSLSFPFLNLFFFFLFFLPVFAFFSLPSSLLLAILNASLWSFIYCVLCEEHELPNIIKIKRQCLKLEISLSVQSLGRPPAVRLLVLSPSRHRPAAATEAGDKGRDNQGLNAFV